MEVPNVTETSWFDIGRQYGQRRISSRFGTPRGDCGPVDRVLRYGIKGPQDRDFMSGFTQARRFAANKE